MSRYLLRAADQEPLTYLQGGEHHAVDVAHFPDLGKRLVRSDWSFRVYDDSEGHGFER